jgi:hypothetical protein
MHAMGARRATVGRWTAFLVGASALWLAACDDSARPTEHTVYIEGPERDGGHSIGPEGDGDIPPPPPDDGGVIYTRILVVSGDDEITVNVGGTAELGVLLFDAHGDPVPNGRIQFAIEDEDPGDAALASQRVQTDDDGYAAVNLQAGTSVRDLSVQAWGEDTRIVEFTVHVVALPAGNLDVGFDYEGPAALGNVEAYILSDASICEDPYYLTAPEDVVLSAVAMSPQDRLPFGPLPAGRSVTIFARGRLAATGILAAGGCLSDVQVPNAMTKRVEVPLFLLPLNPAGTYTVRNDFDFTNAIPGTLGQIIQEMVQFFGDRAHPPQIASVIFDLVENLVRDAAGAIGGIVVDLVRGWVEDDLNDLVNNYIQNDAPQWVRDFFTVGQDIVGVVSQMEVISKVRLSKVRQDGTFDGSQNWIGLTFYWRLPCQGNPDPNCGRHDFTMDEVAAALEGVNLVYGQFTGRLHSYDQGIINSHTLDLQYGRLILFVLDHVILPAIADGAMSLREGLLNLANCPAFADDLTGGHDHLRIGGINIVSRDTIEGWCTSVIGLAGDAAEAIVGHLRIDTHLTLDGTMRFVETTNDLVPDQMTEGVWNGVIRTSEDQGPPFHGTFSGDRDP